MISLEDGDIYADDKIICVLIQTTISEREIQEINDTDKITDDNRQSFENSQ